MRLWAGVCSRENNPIHIIACADQVRLSTNSADFQETGDIREQFFNRFSLRKQTKEPFWLERFDWFFSSWACRQTISWTYCNIKLSWRFTEWQQGYGGGTLPAALPWQWQILLQENSKKERETRGGEIKIYHLKIFNKRLLINLKCSV